jgi:hypothetical protein
MRKKQIGMGILGFVLIFAAVILVAVAALKIGPAYSEFSTAKRAIVAIAQGGEARGGTVADVRKAFDRRANVDAITVITPQDLEVTKDGSELVISFAYAKKVPLFANVAVCIDFFASTSPTAVAPTSAAPAK